MAGTASDHVSGPARTYRLHAAKLATCSPYFRARTAATSGTLAFADGARSEKDAGVAGAQPTVLVEYVDAALHDAMEAVLRHCYTGALSEEVDKDGQLSVAELLSMAALADRFDVRLCVTHCLEEVAGRKADAFDMASCSAIFGGLPPGLECHALHGSAVQAATQHLLSVLGDAEAVCGAWYDVSSDLDEQLLRLSLPELLAVLNSDRLKARSENSVLMMADAWAMGPRGRACVGAQLRKLTEVVRLGQLSKSCTFDVLPALPWLQLSAAEIGSLVRFAAAGPIVQSRPYVRTPVQESMVNDEQVHGPEAWYGARPRVAWPGPPQLTLQWTVPRQELALCLKNTGVLPHLLGQSHCCFFNGFCVGFVLHIREAATGLRATMGHVTTVLSGGLEGRAIFLRAVSSEVQLGVMEADRGTYADRKLAPFSTTSRRCTVCEVFSRVRSSELLSAEGWGPYLVSDKLHLQGVVFLAE